MESSFLENQLAVLKMWLRNDPDGGGEDGSISCLYLMNEEVYAFLGFNMLFDKSQASSEAWPFLWPILSWEKKLHFPVKIPMEIPLEIPLEIPRKFRRYSCDIPLEIPLE